MKVFNMINMVQYDHFLEMAQEQMESGTMKGGVNSKVIFSFWGSSQLWPWEMHDFIGQS